MGTKESANQQLKEYHHTIGSQMYKAKMESGQRPCKEDLESGSSQEQLYLLSDVKDKLIEMNRTWQAMHLKDHILAKKNRQKRSEMEKLQSSLGMTDGDALIDFVKSFQHIAANMMSLQINFATLESSLDKGFSAIVNNNAMDNLIAQGNKEQREIIDKFIEAVAAIMPILSEYYKHPIQTAQNLLNSLGSDEVKYAGSAAIGSAGHPQMIGAAHK